MIAVTGLRRYSRKIKGGRRIMLFWHFEFEVSGEDIKYVVVCIDLNKLSDRQER